VDQLIQWDPNATVQVTTDANGVKKATVVNSCAPACSCPGNPNSTCPNGPGVSPRVAVVPVCAPSDAGPGCADGGANNGNITIKEFLAFFIVDSSGSGNNYAITATLINTAGALISSGTPVPPGGAFLETMVLIR
jgi:hypothetical protein